MISVVFTMSLAVIGMLILAPLMHRLPRYAVVALGVPVGAAAYILAGLGLLTFGVRFATARALLLSALLGLGLAIAASIRSSGSRDHPSGREIVDTTVLGCLLIGSIATFFQLVPLTRLNTDSYLYLTAAETLERTGSLATIDPLIVRMRLIGAPFLHTIGSVSGLGYSPSITPVIGASAFFVMGWICCEAFEKLATPRRWRLALVVTALLTLLASNRLVFHLFYVNGHLVFATLLLAGLGLAWLGAIERRTAFLVPAGIAFGALAVVRPESSLTVAVFLIPFLVPGRADRAGLVALIAPFVAAVIMWNGLVYPPHAVPGELGLLGPVRGPLFAAAAICGALVVGGLRVSTPLLERAPQLALGAAVAFVVASTLFRPHILFRTINATAVNLLSAGMWGALWLTLIPLVALAAWGARFPLQRLWIEPLVLFGVMFFVFAFLRGSPYRIGWSDSGSRMLMHVAFVATTYVVISMASLIRPSVGDEEITVDLTEVEAMGAPPDPAEPAAHQSPVLG